VSNGRWRREEVGIEADSETVRGFATRGHNCGVLLAQRWDGMEGSRRTVPNWGLEYSYFVSWLKV